MTVAARADDVLDEGAVAQFKPRQRILHLMAAPLRQHLAGLAVVVQIHQERELDAVPVFDQMLFPLAALGSGILVPPDAVAVRGGADDVGIAVAVDVQREIGEIFGGVAEILDGSKAVLDPVRPLIPVLSGHDIGMPVAIDVGDRAGFVTRPGRSCGARMRSRRDGSSPRSETGRQQRPPRPELV